MRESFGPAENIINTLLSFTDHMTHSRPGIVVKDSRSVTGVKWTQATYKLVNNEKVVLVSKRRVGVLQPDNTVVENGVVVGEYRTPSNRNTGNLFPEVATFLYKKVAEVWEFDNKLAAKWASFTYKDPNSSRDLKTVLAAFMLVQSRKGDPIVDDGKFSFSDEDYRDVGEAMCLLPPSKKKDSGAFDAKLVNRVWQVLNVPGVAEINRSLGFTQSTRNPCIGRWEKAAQKWLRYREQNIEMLEGLVKSGQTEIVKNIARRCHYKPLSEKFFDVLRWEQTQSKIGHREINIGKKVAAAEGWAGLSEVEICEKIVAERIPYTRIVGLLPPNQPLTRAMIAASIEIGGISQKGMLILTPTLEKFGLLEEPGVKRAWNAALNAANDMRAANVAKRVQSKDVAEKLESAAENAVKKVVEKAVKNLRVYFIIDRSSSMDDALAISKTYIKKFLGAFPLEQTHVAVFNSYGSVLQLKKGTAAGVDEAFRGVAASGGTSYGQGVLSLAPFVPKDDEDVIFIFVGDEEQAGTFENEVVRSKLRPTAFGLVRVLSKTWIANYPGYGSGEIVRKTAEVLGIPCFMIDNDTFQDTYAIPNTLRALVESTPVNQRATAPSRKTLIEQIMETELLTNPDWAA